MASQTPAPPSRVRGLDHWAAALNSVGWFIPPFVQMGALGRMALAVTQGGGAYGQDDLERDLAGIYRATSLAAMVRLRYPVASSIQDYAVTIEEAVEAHVLGLDHVAVAGLIPVIEGAGRDLAARHGVKSAGVKEVFQGLTDACKAHATERQLGAVDEVLSMLDSFAAFAADFLYRKSTAYPLADKTNRHGITHGAYKDADYGRPLNFFKVIAAVDFLTFVSTFIGGGSWMAPSHTPRAVLLAEAWLVQRERRDLTRGAAMPPELARELAELRTFSAWLRTLPPDEVIPY